MNKLFSRWLPCATLATWSTVLLYMYYSGRIDAFLVPVFRTYVAIAGTLLLGMSLVFLLFPADADCCSSAECGHGLSRLASGKILTFLILLLPVTAAAVFSPDEFSKDAILNRGIVTDASGLRPPGASRVPLTVPDLPLPTNDPSGVAAATPIPVSPQAQSLSMEQYFQRTPDGRIIAEVLDLLYAAQDDALRADFNEKPVELIGQMMPATTNNAKGHRFKAVRMFMTCCAADARPVATLVECDKLPEVPEMTWVKISGKATFPIENGRRISVIQAEKVEKTDPPEESMLF
jgi:uncharacterized repeat protein (TIGR03943 family)